MAWRSFTLWAREVEVGGLSRSVPVSTKCKPMLQRTGAIALGVFDFIGAGVSRRHGVQRNGNAGRAIPVREANPTAAR